MDTTIKKCYICNKFFSDKPFENMNVAGEPTTSKIELFDEVYILCPKCTQKLNRWVLEQQKNFL